MHRLPLADIQFIADFAAYARSRGEDEYNYTSGCECACAQFLRDTGRAVLPVVVPRQWCDGLRNYPDGLKTLPEGVEDAISMFEFRGGGAFWSFSALASRLEALLCDAPAVERVS